MGTFALGTDGAFFVRQLMSGALAELAYMFNTGSFNPTIFSEPLQMVVSRFEGGLGTAFCSESSSCDPPSPGSLLILQVYFYFNVIWRGVAFYFDYVLGSAVVTLHCVPCVCRVPRTTSVEVTFSMFIFFSVDI